jgi:hypothetical protein
MMPDSELDKLELGDRVELYLRWWRVAQVVMSARYPEPVNRFLLRLMIAMNESRFSV